MIRESYNYLFYAVLKTLIMILIYTHNFDEIVFKP